MNKEIELVKKFHEKFNVPILSEPTLIGIDRAQNRFRLMKDEVVEYIEGIENNDLENVAKELVDILYATYGTILEHGLQDKIEDVFNEVHKSNMSKDYHEYKMIKGDNYREANIRI